MPVAYRRNSIEAFKLLSLPQLDLYEPLGVGFMGLSSTRLELKSGVVAFNQKKDTVAAFQPQRGS